MKIKMQIDGHKNVDVRSKRKTEKAQTPKRKEKKNLVKT